MGGAGAVGRLGRGAGPPRLPLPDTPSPLRNAGACAVDSASAEGRGGRRMALLRRRRQGRRELFVVLGGGFAEVAVRSGDLGAATNSTSHTRF
jgi:hypothetical protein